jgi:hypothetical protein
MGWAKLLVIFSQTHLVALACLSPPLSLCQFIGTHFDSCVDKTKIGKEPPNEELLLAERLRFETAQKAFLKPFVKQCVKLFGKPFVKNGL